MAESETFCTFALETHISLSNFIKTMETNNTTKIDMRIVPASYVCCFNDQCPRCHQCLRWMVGQSNQANGTISTVVLPTVLKLKQCPEYRSAEQVTMAWGFSKLFDDVKSKHETPLRDAMKRYLGGNGTYSRYKLGRRLLTPEQQAHIIGLFRAKGYTEGLQFDHYVTTYNFDD